MDWIFDGAPDLVGPSVYADHPNETGFILVFVLDNASVLLCGTCYPGRMVRNYQREAKKIGGAELVRVLAFGPVYRYAAVKRWLDEKLIDAKNETASVEGLIGVIKEHVSQLVAEHEKQGKPM